MDKLVYILCTGTSLLCAILLLRGYRRTSARLLFWSGLCFCLLTVANVLLFVDLIVFPAGDLMTYRSVMTLAAVSVLVFGLIWETV